MPLNKIYACVTCHNLSNEKESATIDKVESILAINLKDSRKMKNCWNSFLVK